MMERSSSKAGISPPIIPVQPMTKMMDESQMSVAAEAREEWRMS